MLAVPAAALMLGAAEAGSTVGLNFQDYYYANGGSGYQTTGMPVTGPAFGVPAANWTSTVPLSCGHENVSGVNDGINGVPIALTGVAFGGLTASVNAPNAWQSGIGLTAADFAVVAVPAPGNNEVTWGYIGSGYGNEGAAGSAPSVSISGLAAKFPDGYVIQAIASHKGTATFDPVDFTDGVTTKSSTYSVHQVTGVSDAYGYGSGSVGLSASSGKFTNNTIQIKPQPQTAGNNSVLAGFIITDRPVVTSCLPASSTIPLGAPISLTGTVIGLGTFTYQWKHNGANVGTNSPTYTVPVSTLVDAGDYTLVVTSNLYPAEPATSQVAKVKFNLPVTWDGNTTTAAAQDGSGTWDNSTANWWDGSADVPWTAGNPATFGSGTAGTYTVTLAESVTSGNLTFANGSYTISPAASQNLTLAGTKITTNADATITAPVSGTTGLNKLGTGTLTLTNNGNNFTGPVVVDAGTLGVSRGSAGSSLTINAGATAVTSVADAIGYATNCKTLNVNGGTFRLGITGNGVWAMNTTLNNASMTSVTGGVWSFGGGSQIANTGTSNFTGGTLLIREGNPNETLPITNDGNLTWNCPINGSNRSLGITGTGTTTFAGASTSLAKVTVEENGSLAVTDSLTGTSLIMKNKTSLSVKSKGATSAITLGADLSLSNYPDDPSAIPNVANFSSVSSTSVAIINASNIFLDNPVTINIQSVVPVVGLYPLMTTTGTVIENGITLGTKPSGVNCELVNELGTTGNLYLKVNSITVPSLTWTGVQPGGIWDIGTTANWTPTNYQNGSIVTFDDSVTTGTTDVKLNITVQPSTVIFNNTAKTYTLSGSGAIAGATSLVMNGSGSTTISTNNTFTGGTSINGGTLILLDTIAGSFTNNSILEINATTGPLTSASSITGPGTLTKSGTNTLTVTSGLELGGATTVAGGVLEIQSKAADSAYVVGSGATLKLGYSTAGGYANTNLKLHGDGAAATTGLYLKGGISYNVSGVLELLDAPTTIRQYGKDAASLGIFDINGTGLMCTANASGSATDSNVKFISMGYGMSINTESGAQTATGDFVLNGPLDVNSNDYGLYKRGAGSLRLNSAATVNNKGVKILGGSVICGVADCIGANADVRINAGCVLNLNGFNQTASRLYFDGDLKAAGTWGAPGSGAAHTDSLRFSGTGVLNVATGVTGYESWSTTYANGAALNVDSDNDGVSNGVEYFMGDTNSGFTANPGISNGMVSWPKGVNYPGVYGTDYMVQTSPDLVIWTDVPQNDSNLVIGATVTYTVPSGNPKVFTRLKVTGP